MDAIPGGEIMVSVDRDDHGMVRRVELPGALLACRPDPRRPGRPWMLRLSDDRHIRLDTVELDKVAYLIGLARAVEEPEAGR